MTGHHQEAWSTNGQKKRSEVNSNRIWLKVLMHHVTSGKSGSAGAWQGRTPEHRSPAKEHATTATIFYFGSWSGFGFFGNFGGFLLGAGLSVSSSTLGGFLEG